MSNYPPGAENDPNAPYNEILPKEEIFQYELKVRGKVYITSYSEEEVDEKTTQFVEKLEDLIQQLSFIDDFSVEESFAEVW